MSNFLGKTLIEAKKVGSAISKSTKEVGCAVGKAASNVANYTKKSAKIAMIKAEMDTLYENLGKAVFKYGMSEENEVALNILAMLLEKREELKTLTKELESDKCTCDCNEESCDCENECTCEDNCNCADNCEKENCDCECHDEPKEEIKETKKKTTRKATSKRKPKENKTEEE